MSQWQVDAHRRYEGNVSAPVGLYYERACDVYFQSGSTIQGTVTSRTLTIGMSTNAYSRTYTCRFKVEDGNGNSVEVSGVAITFNSGNYTQAYFPISFPEGAVNWNNIVRVYAQCTAVSTGGDRNAIFIKGAQVVSIDFVYTVFYHNTLARSNGSNWPQIKAYRSNGSSWIPVDAFRSDGSAWELCDQGVG